MNRRQDQQSAEPRTAKEIEADLDALEFELEAEENEVQSLVWALMDEHISADDVKRLEELLLTDPEARKTYIECVQLHVDLQHYFSQTKTAQPPDPKQSILTLPGFTGLADMPTLPNDV